MKAAAPMEGQKAQPPSDPSAAVAVAAYPRWVMLETLAAARTSTGHLIQVSLRLTEPPGVSCVCLHLPAGFDSKYSRVVAAHGDSVLIDVPHSSTTDHFVYSAGDAAADPPRPPSLSLLPPCGLDRPTTGLVLRGEDFVVVAELKSVPAGPDTPELMREADLSLFRAGEWSVKRVQISFHDAGEVQEKLPVFWNSVFAVGDGLLICWVDLWRLGVVLCDVFEETPRLQYLPLPRKNVWGPPSNWNVCATAGGDALRFINVFPRCCCGGERSCHAYTIQTWTMRIGGDDMEWVMDGMVDSTELWALHSYKGLRRFPLDHPVVSLDQPEIICFWLHETKDGYGRYSDTTVDVLMVNTRSKRIHSVSRSKNGLFQLGDGLIPSNVSCFFNSYVGSRGRRQEDDDRPLPVIVDEQLMREDDQGSKPTKLASFAGASVQVSEIFEAYQEISSYGLGRDDEIKVDRILSHDNCRRFISLLRLPKNLRKDWLLMEIKASED